MQPNPTPDGIASRLATRIGSARLLLAGLALAAGLPGWLPAAAADRSVPGTRCLAEGFNPRSPELSLVCSDIDLLAWLAERGLAVTDLLPVPATLPDGRRAPGLYSTAGGEQVLLAPYVSDRFHPPEARSRDEVRTEYLATLGIPAEAVTAAGGFVLAETPCLPDVELAVVGYTPTTYSDTVLLLRHCHPNPQGPYFGRRILYHEGHDHVELSDGIDTVRWLAGLGFEVYVAEMPLFGRNTILPEDPQPPVLTHEEYAEFERNAVSPLWSEILTPIASFIPELRRGASGPVGLIGRSGGGMTAYSIGLAHPAVDYVISIAGGTPLSMRLAATAGAFEIGDWEQWSPRTYSRVGHEELQRHAGRLGSLHLYGGLDPCCFQVTPGDGFHEWLGLPTGDGRIVEIFVDPVNDIHGLSVPGKAVVTGFFDRVFALPRLTVSVSGAPGGRVVSAPDGIDCGNACEASFPAGQAVDLTASAPAGYFFAGWSGACTGSGACRVILDSGRQVGATFSPIVFPLAVTVSGEGRGTVASVPAGIDCGATCAADFPEGTMVTLTATAAPDSTFTGWDSACPGTGPCTVTLTAARQVTATFALRPTALQVTRAGDGTGTVASSPAGIDCGATCAAEFPPGATVTLTATASPDSTFTGWSGACTGAGPCTVTVSTPRQVTATFALRPYTLQVTRAGDGTGTVASSPAGIDCGVTCAAEFPQRTLVTLTATAAADSTFTGWGGACTGTGPCDVTMTAARQVTATFAVRRHALQVTRAGDGAGTVVSTPAGIDCGAVCAADFPVGTAVTLVATPAADSRFLGWGGACTGTDSCVVAMDAVKGVSATFGGNQSAPRLANISTRMQVLTGDDVLIAGFVIGGTKEKTVVVRARGPSLAPFGIANPLADPQLQLFAGSTQIRYSDDWGDGPDAATLPSIGLQPTHPKESAILARLAPGAYTAIVSGVAGGTGIGIVEVFEVDSPEAPLVNISSRGRSFSGNEVMIAGFVIQGDSPQTVIVRARGPSLAAFGITGHLVNPTLLLFAGQTFLASNEDWVDSPDAARIQSLGFAPTNMFEAAVLVTLPPGAYTALVSDALGRPGVGIVEVFTP